MSIPKKILGPFFQFDFFSIKKRNAKIEMPKEEMPKENCQNRNA